MSALISADGLYRYQLHRTLRDWPLTERRACVVMVNPSTADAEKDDATIRRLKGFGKSLVWSAFTVVNLFAYRATDVNMLKTVDDPIGPLNDGLILAAMMRSDMIIVAWGSSGKLPPHLRDRWRKIVAMADALGEPLYCWGTCGDGHPRHPLMLDYETPLAIWEPPL